MLVEDEKISHEEAVGIVDKGFFRADIQALDRALALEEAQVITGVKMKSLQEVGRDMTYSAIIDSLTR